MDLKGEVEEIEEYQRNYVPTPPRLVSVFDDWLGLTMLTMTQERFRQVVQYHLWWLRGWSVDKGLDPCSMRVSHLAPSSCPSCNYGHVNHPLQRTGSGGILKASE